MLELLSAAIRPLWLPILKIGGVIFSVILILLKVRQSGKDAARVENLKITLKGMQTRDKIENDIAITSDDKYERMLKKWRRD